MATEKFQASQGHDNPNHNGYHANRQGLEESQAQLTDFQLDLNYAKKLREQHNQALADHTFWRGKYWEGGMANPGGIRQDDGKILRNGILFEGRKKRKGK